ncbi:SufS family cysteine desulfurase [Agrococcus sp. SCSIO52902]|uniref:aminotransferase class V-fold PLP-dependent enzyme n=1 Tax=Agrococcus sp. SCSIO52902 TaxID=2933290 RepID=UPI001FF6D2F8|nr:SufS family cysteine desulfurase [Agrococcus sp. SCSIO52902]UOV99712.1 SufS family cysteine desulfurase [Agrococcus sp. SCSIO52902]
MTIGTQPALTEERIQQLRGDFPILAEQPAGVPLVYLDSGATSQQPRQVLEAEWAFRTRHNAAVHRGAHTLASLATDDYESARDRVARFVGARPTEISWAMNATDALNTVALSLAEANRAGDVDPALRIREGDEILVTEAEHHANLLPWQRLADETGARLRWVEVDDDGVWTADAALALITERTRVVAVAHVSNVTGLIAPVEPIVAAAHAVGALVVLDACQSVPHRRVELGALGVDAAAFSGHKMLGPGGIGVLYLAERLGAALPPARVGGSMITTVTMTEREFLPAPQRFEAGTQPVSAIVGLAAAVDYLEGVGMAAIEAHEVALGERLAAGAVAIEGVRLVGPPPGVERAGLASVVVDGVHAHDVGQVLDAAGIAARVGHHCAQPLHRRLGVAATTRASTYLHTTEAEVDRFLDVLSTVRGYFGAGRA